MKIAAFYDDLVSGAKASGVPVEKAVRDLMADGLELLYISGFAVFQNRESIEKLMADTGIGVEGLYMFYEFGRNHEDRSYEKLIDDAAALGASNVLLVPGFLSRDDSPEEQKRQIDNMVTALKGAVAYGQSKGVAVSMEDFDGEQAPYCSIEGMNFFLQAVPGLTCSFDTGNFVVLHEDELEAFELFKNRLCTLHLKDRSTVRHFEEDRATVCTDGVEVYPEVVGSGFIRIAEILERLKAMNYSGNVIAEICGCSREHILDTMAASVRWLKERV